MRHNLFSEEEINYRALYGKLFSEFLNRFGSIYVYEIEDAVQNSFLKLLKIRKQNNTPKNIENWLFIVARNDLLNQIKHKQKEDYSLSLDQLVEEKPINNEHEDLRLQTILFIISLKNISTQAKVLFILKNIFGLSVLEIHENTLINDEAIYKSINRTRKNLLACLEGKMIDITTNNINQKTISIVEEILYAVFNIGFDSFSEKAEHIVNEDLCLEAFALAKFLYRQFNYTSTSNLLALFCFHISRIPAKIENGKLISFFNQNRKIWDRDFLNMGFYYLRTPKSSNKFYIEAIIISKYMSLPNLNIKDWTSIATLYEIMEQVSQSPIVKLNYAFCLSKIGKMQEALEILSKIEKELPDHHFYFSLVKAKLLKEIDPEESYGLYVSAMNKMSQKIRKEYLLMDF